MVTAAAPTFLKVSQFFSKFTTEAFSIFVASLVLGIASHFCLISFVYNVFLSFQELKWQQVF